MSQATAQKALNNSMISKTETRRAIIETPNFKMAQITGYDFAQKPYLIEIAIKTSGTTAKNNNAPNRMKGPPKLEQRKTIDINSPCTFQKILAPCQFTAWRCTRRKVLKYPQRLRNSLVQGRCQRLERDNGTHGNNGTDGS